MRRHHRFRGMTGDGTIPCGICTAMFGPGDRACPGCRRPVTAYERGAFRADTRAWRLFGMIAALAGVFGGWAAFRSRPRHVRPTAAQIAAAIGGERVDTGRVQIAGGDHSDNRIAVISFRTRQEGWVTLESGYAFHTVDGGETFTPVPANGHTLAFASRADGAEEGRVGYQSLQAIHWLSPERGVAFGTNVPALLVTTDAGASWTWQSRLDEKEWYLFASAHAGRSLWTCGYEGPIYRSRDGGDSFQRTRTTPFSPKEKCVHLSFADESVGWAASHDTLYETRDGGDTWKQFPHLSSGRGPDKNMVVRAILRVSATEGWMVADNEDRSWSSPRSERVWSSLALFTADAGINWWSRRLSTTIAAKLRGGSASGEGVVFATQDERLRFMVGDELVRETPMIEQRGREMGVIRGREPLEPGHIVAFAGQALIESFDDGRSWSTFARVEDGTIRRSLQVDDQLRLVELADGRVLQRFYSGGVLRFEASKQAEFDRYRMNVVENRRNGKPAPTGPFAALAQAREGSLVVTVQKVRASHADVVRIAWTDRKATIGGLDIGPTELRRLLFGIAVAVEQPDDGCRASVLDFDDDLDLNADLAWQLGAAPIQHAAFRDRAGECNVKTDGPIDGRAHRVRVLLAPYITAHP